MQRMQRRLMFVVALLAAVMVCALAMALPTGGWVMTEDLECVDSELVCAEWEFAGGGRTEPCCVSMGDFSANRPNCASTEYR